AAPLALPFRDSHVVLAGASAPDLSATNIGAGSPSELGRIPSGVFLALGAGPAPGISVGLPMETQRHPDPSERLVTPPLGLLYPEAIVQVPILLQSQHSGTGQAASESGGIASLLEGLMENAYESKWKQFLDLLHRLGTTPPPDSYAPDRIDDSQ